MEREIIADGGVQYVPQITAVQQIIYLDIDGASTNYNGEILTVENVEVQDSGLSAERIEAIAAALNSCYADKNILFVTEKPEYAEYSTIYIGKTGAFSEYGNFTGLAETLDESNQNKTDQAFVMLDAASTNEEIAEIIAHEAEHITGQLNHGGEGLNAYAAQRVVDTGVTSSGLKLGNGTLFKVCSGASAIDTVATGCTVSVYAHGVMENTTLNGGLMAVNGIAENTTLNNAATLEIADGGTASNTIVSKGCMIDIAWGGIHKGTLTILQGGTVNAVTRSQIDFTVSAITTEDDYLINNLSMISGAPTYTITVSADQAFGTYKLAQGAGNFTGSISIGDENTTYGIITVNGDAFEYGNVKYTLTQNGGNLLLDVKDKRPPAIFIYSNEVLTSSGVEITGKELLAGDSMFVSSGGIAENTVISNGGSATQEMAGRMGNTSVCSGGTLVLNYGVHYGTLYFAEGANVIIGNSPTVEFTVAGRSTDDDYLINDYSFFNKRFTHTIKVDIDQAFGTYKLAQGAENFSGSPTVHNGTEGYGVVTVNGDSLIYNNVQYTLTQTNGDLLLDIQAAVTPTVFIYSNGILTSSGTEITGAVLAGGGNNSMSISSGGSAIDTIVNEYGWLDVFNGGTANNTTLAAVTGTITLLSGGVANDTIINSGVLNFADGGTANRTTVNSGGNIIFYDNGEMFDLTLKAGGTINGFAFAGDRQFEHISYVNGSFAIADNVTIGSLQRGMTVSNGGIIDGVNAGLINVLSGGSITNTRAGDICILNGGVASNTIFAGSSGDLSGTMNISSGAIHRGTLQINTVTYCSAYAGAIIDFTLTDRTVEDGYLIDNISRISGAPTYTITVKANQAFGTYKLAQGAGNFTGSVSIGDDSTTYGVITVNGDEFEYNNIKYTLTQTEGNLILDIANSPSVFIYDGETVTSEAVAVNDVLITGDGNNLMHVSSGGTAVGTQVTNGGEVSVLASGVVENTSISTDGVVDVVGGSANTTTLNDGLFYVSSGGVAENTTVNSNGWMFVDDGTVNKATVNVGGNLVIGFDGTATEITENGGVVSAADGAAVTFTANTVKDLSITNSMTVHSNTVAENITLENAAQMEVFDGGIANKTEVKENATLLANDGAVVNSTAIQAGGKMHIYDGAAANETTIYGQGSMLVSEGGIVSNTNVEVQGSVCVSQGGSAVDTVLNGGFMTVYTGGYVSKTEINDKSNLRISSGASADRTTINDGTMYLYSKTTAKDVTINSGGSLLVSRGATVENVAVNGGYMSVIRDASVTNAMLETGADVYVSSAGTLKNATVNAGANLTVSANGNALQITENGGTVTVQDGANVVFTANTISNMTITGGAMTVHSNTVANTITLANGWMEIYAGGIADKTTVDADGMVYIFSGGTDNNAQIKAEGSMHISGGGTVNNTTVQSDGMIFFYDGAAGSNISIQAGGILGAFSFDKDLTIATVAKGSAAIDGNAVVFENTLNVNQNGVISNVKVHAGGSMHIKSGALVSGELQLDDDAQVTAAKGAVINFTLTGRTAESDYLINNIALISGSPTYTITLASDQAYGTYKLAQGAKNFTATLTISDDTATYGTVTVNGDVLKYKDVQYTLTVSNGNLLLDIAEIIYNVFTYKDGECTSSATEIANAVISPEGNNYLHLAYGGIADNTVVESGGSMLVESGATANGIEIAAGAQVTISGNANNVTLADGAYVNDFDQSLFSLGSTPITFTDGKADIVKDHVTLAGNWLHVNSWVVYNINQSGGYINLHNGAVADYTTIQAGRTYVYSGGSASWTTVTKSGQIILTSGGSAYATTIEYNGELTVAGNFYGVTDQIENVAGIDRNATVARENTINAGCMYVYYGKAVSTYLAAAGRVRIYTGGVADTLTVYGGIVEVYNGGSAIGADVVAGGAVIVNTGATADKSILSDKGSMTINNGGMATDTTVNSGGVQTIKQAGSAYDTTVNSSGVMIVEDGGIAYNATVTNWGKIEVLSGGTISGATADKGWIYMSGGTADYTTVNSGGGIAVSSGAVAGNTTVNDGGELEVHDGGVANGITVMSGGKLETFTWPSQNGTGNYSITNLSLQAGARFDLDITTQSYIEGWSHGSYPQYGSFEIKNGVINYFDITEGNGIRLYNGCVASNIEIFGDDDDNCNAYMFLYAGAVASNTSVSGSWNYLDICGGSANATTVADGARVEIEAGGTATSTTIDDKGLMTVYSDSLATETTIKSGGTMFVSNGATASNTKINAGGGMYVYSGGIANSIGNYGNLSIYKDAIASGISLTGTEEQLAEMLLQGNADKVTVNSNGFLNIIGGSASNVFVYSGGRLDLSGGFIDSSHTSAGAIINGITYKEEQNFYDNKIKLRNGYVSDYGYVWSNHNVTLISINTDATLQVYAGAVITDTTVKAGGSMTLAGKHSGSLQIEDGGSVTAESTAVIDFTLTGRTAESDYLINDLSLIAGAPTYTITVSADQACGTYQLAQGAENFTGTLTVGDGTDNFGTITVNGAGLVYNSKLYLLTQTNGDLMLSLYSVATPENLQGSASGVTWSSAENALSYNVQYSSDNFASALTVNTVNTAVDTYCLPADGQLWRVQASGGDWSESQFITDITEQTAPELAVSDKDGNLDLFFANSKGIWEQGYAAKHLGNKSGWTGTNELVMLTGKNKLVDIFVGSTDANVLVMTDDANGDALFVDDIYSALPGSVAEQQARIAQINEIRAGAGDDVIDMTSQRFEYVGNGVTVYGGLGNDTIWANNGENKLFGDAGNDRIVGGYGNDIIAGGAGNDSMHGGGGADTFCFGSAWGIDTVEQLESGSVTLWFESGSANNWNAETLTYSDGVNSVTVSGIANESITLKFGDRASTIAGAFDNAASEKVFEDKDKALIA